MSLVLGPDRKIVTRSGGGSLLGSLAERAAGAASQATAMAGIRMIEGLLGMRLDPAPAYLFYVELSGIIVALFTECSGLQVKRDVLELKEGGLNHYVHKLPGRVEYTNITLKRGLSMSRALWDWFSVGMHDFNVQRLNFSIIQGAPGHNLLSMGMGAIAGVGGITGGAGETVGGTVFQALGRGFGKVKHWDVEDAFPVKWVGPSLSASSKNAAIEEIEIAHHGLSLSYEVGTPMSVAASIAGAAASGVGAGMGALGGAAGL